MKILQPIAFVVTLLVLAACPCLAGKTTVDPNKVKPAVLPQERPDLRLDRKVSYFASDKRLHSILEDLSRQTGVILYSGKSHVDWQVRDLPVLVCVIDVTLGRLLHYLADSTHLALKCETVNNVKHYRIYRDIAREKQLVDYYRKKDAVLVARAKWEWDSLVQFGRKYADNKPPGTTMAQTVDMGLLYASLSKSEEDALLAGKRITLSTRDPRPAVSTRLRTLYLDWWHGIRDSYTTTPNTGYANPYDRDLNENDIACISLDIKLPKGYATCLQCASLRWPFGVMGDNPISVGSYDVLLEETSASSTEPRWPQGPRTALSPELVQLDLHKPAGTLLEKKIKIAFPSPGEQVTYDGLVRCVAQAAGVSIIQEDFQQHRWSPKTLGRLDLYDREITLADALLAIRKEEDYRAPHTEWYLDARNNILVGTLSGEQTKWQPGDGWWELHHSLAPEPFIGDLIKKYNGDGLDIDDVASAMLLTEEQRREWIFFNKDLLTWDSIPHTTPFWRLYANLSSEDKALARQPDGLMLGMLRPDVLRAAFVEAADLAESESLYRRDVDLPSSDDKGLMKRLGEWRQQHYPEMERTVLGQDPLTVDIVQMTKDMLNDFPEIRAMWDIPTDPVILGRLRMRLVTKENAGEAALSENGRVIQNQSTRSYTLAIQGEGVNLLIRSPIYSYPYVRPGVRASR